MTAYLEVEFTVALARPTGPDAHVESDERVYTYYFSVPDAWTYLIDDELQLRVFDVAERMYVELNRQLRAAEPAAATFLKVKSTRARMLPAAEVATQPWRTSTNTPPWERSPAVSVAPDGSFRRAT
jgi:hypothetical protein